MFWWYKKFILVMKFHIISYFNTISYFNNYVNIILPSNQDMI